MPRSNITLPPRRPPQPAGRHLYITAGRTAFGTITLTSDIEVGGLRYTCTVGHFGDNSIAEVFLQNHKSNSLADTNARDAAITFSIAVQHGADPEVIRRALCRDSAGRASGPLGAALDRVIGDAL